MLATPSLPPRRPCVTVMRKTRRGGSLPSRLIDQVTDLLPPCEVDDRVVEYGPKRPVELATMPRSRFTEAVTQDYRNILWF